MCSVIFEKFPDTEVLAGVATAGIAWGAMKQQLFEYLNEHIGPAREEYGRLIADPAIVEAELQKGAERARAVAVPYMDKIRAAIGIRRLG